MTKTAPGAIPPAFDIKQTLNQALESKGDAYRPRTGHLTPAGEPHYTNRLILEASPYLIQHAHNPVDWRPWGDEAFAEAKARGVPVLLSVGYSTCHWCHVMEHESFEDLEIAEVMNRRYVCVKVDREVLPDVDSVYMSAVQALTGRGGWPMTVWLTEERHPFYGGTYFPPRSGMRGVGIGFLSLLNQLADIHAQQPEKIRKSCLELVQAIRGQLQAPPSGELGDANALRSAWDDIEGTFDRRYGGFGQAPKFPMAPTLAFGLDIWAHQGLQSARDGVLFTLKQMAKGGIYDHLGGGFHRYSTDNQWLAPHFEKMLYDQGMLVPLYLGASQISDDPIYPRVARETLDYVAREMRSPTGAFYAATDADSEGKEGTFFVWSPEAVDAALPPEEAEAIKAFYDVKAGGNWEGRSILHTPRGLGEVAEELGISEATLLKRVNAGKAGLYGARLRREPPHLDDKVITAWSAMMVEAFAKGARVLGEPAYLTIAREAGEALLGERPLRRILGGLGVAYLDDLAFLCGACLSLFEVSGEGVWLDRAMDLAEAIEAQHGDRDGDGYFLAPKSADPLLVREKPYQDGVLPSGNGKHVDNCLRLYALTEDRRYLERGEGILRMGARLLEKAPRAVSSLGTALGRYLAGPTVAMVVGEDGAPQDELMSLLSGRYLPGVTILCVDGDGAKALEDRVPQLAGKSSQGGLPRAYICEEGRCLSPAADGVELYGVLQGLFPALEGIPSAP